MLEEKLFRIINLFSQICCQECRVSLGWLESASRSQLGSAECCLKTPTIKSVKRYISNPSISHFSVNINLDAVSYNILLAINCSFCHLFCMRLNLFAIVNLSAASKEMLKFQLVLFKYYLSLCRIDEIKCVGLH